MCDYIYVTYRFLLWYFFALLEQSLVLFFFCFIFVCLSCRYNSCNLLCFRVFNKVKSRSAHMKSHRPLDAESKRPKLEKPYEKVERPDDRTHAGAEYQSKQL